MLLEIGIVGCDSAHSRWFRTEASVDETEFLQKLSEITKQAYTGECSPYLLVTEVEPER